MNARHATLPSAPAQEERKHLAQGIVFGLMAAGIGALYTVYARWGIARGLGSPDLTALRFGVAGLVAVPILASAWRKDRRQLTDRWRLWLLVALLAGTPFGLLMFGALQFAPTSHSAVFPFSAMSVMGMVMGALVLGDPITWRRISGIAVVLAGLLLVAGLEASSFNARTLLGDAMFIAAGTFWAGFGIVMRKHRLDSVLATAVIAFSALATYVPAYLVVTRAQGLLAASSGVFWTEALIQGLIAGTGTLFTYARMAALLGPARAAFFPALAPGLAALIAWPVLGHIPSAAEATGLLIVMAGLVWAVTEAKRR